MLVKNIDVKAGLVNGSRGVVVGFSTSGLPTVRFRSGAQHTMHPENWTVQVGVGRSASRRQVPLVLAWGISIHKSQGMTLDAVS
jgi:ATP-dependent DNA helicase PIF1